MAILIDRGLLGKLRGSIGKQFVIKQYKGKTVIAAYPVTKSKKRRKPGALKKMYEDDFAKAVKYAQGIIRDVKLKAAYSKKTKPGQSVYHYAISEYKKKFGIKKERKK